MCTLMGDRRQGDNELLEVTLYVVGSISFCIILPSFPKELFPILNFNRLHFTSHYKGKHV